MSTQWHYSKDGEQGGPVSEDRLNELVVSKRLLPSDQVWREGMSAWAKAGDALPALFPQEPPPLPSESSSGVPGLAGRALRLVLDKEWQEFLDDAGATWRGTSRLKKALVGLIVLVILSVTLWLWIGRSAAPSGQDADLWTRLWDGGLITGLASVVFAFLKRKLEAPAASAQTDETASALLVSDDGVRFLGLSKQQWLGVLVALFIPVVLASLVSSFLVGSQVHLWLTGPLLVILGLAISGLSVDLQRRMGKNELAIGAMVGGSALLLYALTCINTRWVLLFYTVVVTFPALHLFTVARRGAPPIRLSASFLTGFGVIGIALLLGITALPRNQTGEADRDESARLVGTWVQTGGGSAFRQPTLTFTTGGTVTWGQEGDSEWVAKFKFNGKTLAIYEDRSFGNKTEYHMDLVSDSEMLLGQANERSPFGGFSVLKGRWQKGAAPEGGKKKKGDFGDDRVPPPPPQMKDLDVKPAPKDPDDPGVARIDDKRIVGKWQIVEGEQKGTATFTEGGTVLFVWFHPGLKKNWTETGNYTLNGKSLKIKASGEYGDESVRKIEFLSDDELLVQRPKGLDFTWLYGRLKRVK
jgi:hypothetical protein